MLYLVLDRTEYQKMSIIGVYDDLSKAEKVCENRIDFIVIPMEINATYPVDFDCTPCDSWSPELRKKWNAAIANGTVVEESWFDAVHSKNLFYLPLFYLPEGITLTPDKKVYIQTKGELVCLNIGDRFSFKDGILKVWDDENVWQYPNEEL